MTDVLKTWRKIPELHFINHYYQNELYIQALAHSVRDYQQVHGRAKHLLFSFHGLPQAFVDRGDPYFDQCHATANLLAEALNLQKSDWSLAFQSRLGRSAWLKPYCDKTLKQLAHEGVESVQVLCPGFSADCSETLDEIARENKEVFLKAGGKRFDYIPALNVSNTHIEMMFHLIKPYINYE